jgi:hypothetical protein
MPVAGAADLALAVFRSLQDLDELADMAQGAVQGQYTFWTTVSSDSPENAFLAGAARVREAAGKVVVEGPLADDWPPSVRPVGLEVYSETDDVQDNHQAAI